MKTVFVLLTVFLLSFNFSYSQTGPWAKYDQEFKDGVLYREASQGNLAEVISIVEGGGNVHFAFNQTKQTILMAAAGSGKIEVVKYLLALGADPNSKDWWNQTALDKARSVGAKDIETLLMDAMSGKQATPTESPVLKSEPQVKSTLPASPKIQPKTETQSQNPQVKIQKKIVTPAIQAPVINNSSSPTKWPSFGSLNVGDSIMYWVPTGWRRGVIKEVGVKELTGKISVDFSHKKYLIDPDAYALSNEWYDWSGVVLLERKPYWTNWFLGEWLIGEVQAYNNTIKDNKEIDSYYYMDASKRLEVFADNTYRWKTSEKKIINGKWKAVEGEPGITLLKGYRDIDWTLRNSTGLHDWQIRKLDMINLKPSINIMSINGKRKTTE